MRWADSFVALDTETTGLDSKARIVEIALVTFEGGKPVQTWSKLLRPKGCDIYGPECAKAFAVN